MTTPERCVTTVSAGEIDLVFAKALAALPEMWTVKQMRNQTCGALGRYFLRSPRRKVNKLLVGDLASNDALARVCVSPLCPCPAPDITLPS